MRSGPCQADILPWILFLILPSIAIATKKHYVIDYGDGLGNASIEFDEDAHTALITPPESTNPKTLINFPKGLVVYVSDDECMVSKLKVGERKYKQYVTHSVASTSEMPTFYVTGTIPPHKVRKFIGRELFVWCKQKPTLRLSKRQPTLPSKNVNLKDDTFDGTTDQLYNKMNEGHQRFKRRAKKDKKSKGRKGKSRGRRGKGKKSKNKQRKTPKTKSLKDKTQNLNVMAPRIEFPLAHSPTNLTEDLGNPQAPADHVVLQEEPYLSTSFIRSGEDGQRFRHYRDFYQEPNVSNSDTHPPDRINRIISQDTRSTAEGQSRISIPETIVKDGQIFYRYDAEENAASEKGQSKRSHTVYQNFMDDDAESGIVYDDYNDSRTTLDEFSSSSGTQDAATVQVKQNNFVDSDHELSHALAQAQMGDGKHGASAGAISNTGTTTHVQGSSDSRGFFIAQAHSMGHQGGGTNLARVFGNKHGVQGSAMAHGNGYQSHVQVDMGAHPSSLAHISSNGGSTLLSSSVQATQLSGSAGAQAYGNGPSASNAHMEFNPTHHSHGRHNGLRGQGLATATVTNTGSTLLTSLTGEIPSGSYLGTAHSSSGTDLGVSTANENNTYNIHGDIYQPNGITHEFGRPDDILDGLTQNGQFHEEMHSENEPFREISPGASDANHSTELSISRHSSGGDMMGNIMETVHQPDMQPEVIVYPASEFSIIDDGGLTVGAGTPPRESEIEQAPISAFEEIQEGVGKSSEGSKAGIVGLATYSHGRLGAPPGPGELLNIPHQQGSSQYDYAYYDNKYNSEYYDEYNLLGSQDPSNLPFFDLGPEIAGFEPLESNYENFQPILAPDQQATPSPVDQFDHLVTPSPNLHWYDESDTQDITPDPPIIVHQVQAPTLLPDDSVSDEFHSTHVQSHYSGISDINPLHKVHLESQSPTLPSRLPETPQTSRVLIAEPTKKPLQLHFPSRTHMSPSHAGPLPDQQLSSVPSQGHRETYSSRVHQDSFESRTNLQPTTEQDPQPRDPITNSVQAEIVRESNMDAIPLFPGAPGSSHTLPGNQGGPIVNVMTLPASEAKSDRSLLYQRPGTPIQPGQKIPGAPGYRVPPGFRGRVILGHYQPISTNSRKVVQGFNTHIQLSPQNPASNTPVYASVSGPGASQQLTSRQNPAGVHITLSGGGGYSQPSHSSATMTQSTGTHTSSSYSARETNQMSMVSSQQALTHSAMRSQPHSTSSAEKSWDFRRHGTATSQKPWSATGNIGAKGNEDSCGYYSMNCEVVYGLYERSKICKPILITIDCCC